MFAHRRSAALVMCTALAFSSFSSVANGFVPLIDLGIPPGFTSSDALWINNEGTALVNSNARRFLRAADGTYTEIESPFRQGRRLNDQGHVAGAVSTTNRAAIRRGPGDYQEIVVAEDSWAMDVNDAGQAIGDIGSEFTDRQVFYFDPKFGDHVISAPGTTKLQEGRAINNLGVATGYGITPDGTRPFKYSPGTGLSFLPTIANGNAFGEDINDAGSVAGRIGATAARWNPDGSVQFLQGGALSCTAINASGDAVGVGLNAAFIWFAGSTQGVELNSLLSPEQEFYWHINWVNSINDHGQVVGRARYDADGPGPASWVDHAFLMQMPEPSTGMLLLAACFVSLRDRSRGRSQHA